MPLRQLQVNQFLIDAILLQILIESALLRQDSHVPYVALGPFFGLPLSRLIYL